VVFDHSQAHEDLILTKDISGVYSGVSSKLNEWFPSVCLSWPYTAFAKIAQCTAKLMLHAGMRLQYSVYC